MLLLSGKIILTWAMPARRLAKPVWLQEQLAAASRSMPLSRRPMERVLRLFGVATVCQAACCPNQGECWSRGDLTFLILGEICTRNCRFCRLAAGSPLPVDEDEPWRLLAAVRYLGLRRLVLTSVTRDDLPDGGATQFAESIRVLRRSTNLVIEILTPDFQGQNHALETVAEASPEVWGHNLETVPRLYPVLRPGADYGRSLRLLARIKELAPEIRIKSGLMLGLGETEAEVQAVLQDLRAAGVEEIALGQYLAPSPRHYPVIRYLDPAEFAAWGRWARELGFLSVRSGPLVRSSYTGS